MHENSVYLCYNANSEDDIHPLHSSKMFVNVGSKGVHCENGDEFTITYSPEDDIHFTDINVVCTKLKTVPTPRETTHRSVDRIIIESSTSLYSIEDECLQRSLPLIQPLLSESQISSLQLHEDCKTNNNGFSYEEGTVINYFEPRCARILKGHYAQHLSDVSLNERSEESIIFHKNFSLEERQVGKYGQDMCEAMQNKRNKQVYKTSINGVLCDQFPSQRQINYQNKTERKVETETKFSSKAFEMFVFPGNKEPEAILSNFTVKTVKDERNVGAFKRKNEGYETNNKRANKREKETRDTKAPERIPLSPKEWKNKLQRSSKTKNEMAETNLIEVFPSNNFEKQQPETKLGVSELIIKTRKNKLNKEGKGNIYKTASRKESSIRDMPINLIETKLVDEFVTGDFSIRKGSDKDGATMSSNNRIKKISKHSRILHSKTAPNVSSEHKKSKKENFQDYRSSSQKVISEDETWNSEQPLASAVTSPSQGHGKAATKSTKVNVTKQGPSSNNESVVTHSNWSFGMNTSKGLRYENSRKSNSRSNIEYAVHYVLSDPVFVEAGWTLEAVDKTLSRIVTFSASPAHPHTYCFRSRSEEERIFYENGNLAVFMRKDGTGEVYYSSGNPAIVATMSSIGMRLIMFTDRNDDKVPARVIGVFDSFGNGFLFNEKGERTITFNQLKGVFNNSSKKILYKWKWGAYKVLEKQRLKELLRSIAEEKKKVASFTKGDRKTPSSKIYLEKVANGTTNQDKSYEDILNKLPFPKRSTPKIKKSNNSPIFKSIIMKANKEMALRISGQDAVFIKFRVGRMSYSIDLGVVVDPYRVERVDEVAPDKLSEVPSVLDHFSASLERLASHATGT